MENKRKQKNPEKKSFENTNNPKRERTTCILTGRTTAKLAQIYHLGERTGTATVHERLYTIDCTSTKTLFPMWYVRTQTAQIDVLVSKNKKISQVL